MKSSSNGLVCLENFYFTFYLQVAREKCLNEKNEMRLKKDDYI